MSTSYWSIDVSFSLVKWCQLLVGQLMSAAHLWTIVSLSLANNWYEMLIGQLMSAAHWPTGCQLLISQLEVNFLLANWCKLLIGELMSAAHWPTDVSCTLANWHQLLIGLMMSVAHRPTGVSCSLANWHQLLIGPLMSDTHSPTALFIGLLSYSFANWSLMFVFELLLTQEIDTFSSYIVLAWKSRIGGLSETIFIKIESLRLDPDGDAHLMQSFSIPKERAMP